MSASAASWKTTFSAIMQRLKRDAGCIYFKQPVDPVALQIPLYPYIIKHPVDLGTIEVCRCWPLTARAYPWFWFRDACKLMSMHQLVTLPLMLFDALATR